MRLDLLRHGDTGRAGFLDGRTDPPLTEAGCRQIETQTRDLRWPLVVCSPLIRARLPAEALAKSTGARLAVDPDWSEMDFGAWDGLLRSDIERDSAAREQLARLYDDPHKSPPPGGESWDDLQARVTRAIMRLVDETHHTHGNVLVIAHAGPIRAALVAVVGMPLAATWAIRIGHGTRLTIDAGVDERRGLWGELVEIRQP